MRKVIRLFGIFILIGIIFFLYIKYLLPLSIPSIPPSLIILDTHNEEIGEIIAEDRIRHRDIGYPEIPEFYRKSIVWLEDRSFWENNGISFRGIARSVAHNLQAGRVVEGASTLSSQFIRNAFWINERRDFFRKIQETLMTIRLNEVWTKNEILTGYINRINFGYLNFGLASASKYYFGKEPKNLTKAEQIALLVIPKNPNKYDPYTKIEAFNRRFELILSTLGSGNILLPQEIEQIRNEKLMFRKNHKSSLPYVVDFIRQHPLGLSGSQNGVLSTTFDKNLTDTIDTLSRNILDSLSWRNVSDYGILIAEKSPSGPILRVMIGGKDYHESKEGQVNTTTSLRQPGSTLKPFTYLLAFQNLGYLPQTSITDLPIQYKTAEGYSYEPKNYSQDYKGEITLAEALSQSINIPAIKLLDEIGVDTLLSFLREIGVTSLDRSSDHYGLSLTLGSGEMTLYELLEAYSIFAYDGQYCKITFQRRSSSPCIRKVDKKYSDMVNAILSDRYIKLGEYPLNSALDFSDRRVTLKTGTSRNFRDNWTVGFTDHYMIGVWTGNKNGENMKGVSGATGAGEIFARIVYALEQEDEEPPIHKDQIQSSPYIEITSPLDGSLFLRERHRSESEQKIRLAHQTNISYDKASWFLDGNALSGKLLPLTPGDHILEIRLEKDGREVQKMQTRYTVRDSE